MYTARVERAVKEFCETYSVAEAAYKRLQTILTKIDDKIHNEFRYCSRALSEFISDTPALNEDEKIGALLRATHAAKNALNDSIDLLVGYARITMSNFSDADSGRELILFIPNLKKIQESLSVIDDRIVHSRSNANGRVGVYTAILDSDEFRVILDFCENIPIIRNNINVEVGRVIERRQQFSKRVAMWVVTSLLSIGVIIVGLPRFISFLAKFFPSLQWLA